jgi:hypothetical protein
MFTFFYTIVILIVFKRIKIYRCEGTRWAWYTLVQGYKQFILDQ